MTIYNPDIDLVNDNVYTKFCPNRSIRFQDIEKKMNYARMTKEQRKSSIAPTLSMRGYNTLLYIRGDDIKHGARLFGAQPTPLLLETTNNVIETQ